MSADLAAFEAAEATYRADLTDQVWLEQLRAKAKSILPYGEVVATAATFRTDVPEDVRLLDYAGNADYLVGLQECLANVSPEVRRQTFASGPAVLLSDRVPPDNVAWDILGRRGVKEVVGFVCRDPGPIGCMVGLNLSAPVVLDDHDRHRLGRLSAHVATALRWRLRKGREEAVLAPDGTLLDAKGDAREDKSREALRFAARSLDRAKARAKRDPQAALAAWHALVEGRWSLLERFDSDARRFWIAVENEPPTISERRLTQVEQRVVGYLVVGHSQKLIAYELGLAQPYVSKLASSACRKLGVKTRAELIELYAALDGAS